jgi:hypothetical protein
MATFEQYSEVIFWNFKRMDNTNYNFEIICCLIEGSLNSKTKHLYYKPIFISMMSIVECVLYDFLCRIQGQVHEGINLNRIEIEKIKNIDLPTKLKNYTDICRKHNLLGKGDDIYDEIIRFSEMRNRVHIQNQKQTKPFDESKLWSADEVKSCGHLIKNIFELLCMNQPRPEGFHSYPDLNLFPTPWQRL